MAAICLGLNELMSDSSPNDWPCQDTNARVTRRSLSDI